jgi:Flp pilus assembly protein TadD
MEVEVEVPANECELLLADIESAMSGGKNSYQLADLFQRLVTEVPTDWYYTEAHHLWGVSLASDKRWALAIKHFQEAFKTAQGTRTLGSLNLDLALAYNAYGDLASAYSVVKVAVMQLKAAGSSRELRTAKNLLSELRWRQSHPHPSGLRRFAHWLVKAA